MIMIVNQSGCKMKVLIKHIVNIILLLLTLVAESFYVIVSKIVNGNKLGLPQIPEQAPVYVNNNTYFKYGNGAKL